MTRRFFILAALQIFLLQPAVAQKMLQTWNNDNRCFPYQFEKVNTWSYTIFADLFGDSLKESLHYQPARVLLDPPFFEIEDINGNVLSRINLNMNCRIQGTISFHDVAGDDKKEIFVPILKNDSLFFYVYTINSATELVLLNHIKIAHGQSRTGKDGQFLEWDAGIGETYFIDINNNGKKELISMVRTPFALYPRGVFIHSYPAGEFIDSFTSGAYPGKPYVADFDDDGFYEMVFRNSTPTNGANANGFSDLYPHLFVLQLGPDTIQLQHVEQLSDLIGTEYWLFNENIIGDAEKEFIAIRTESDNNSKGQIRIYNSSADSLLYKRDYPFLIATVIPINVPNDPHAKILASTKDSLLLLIDDSLRADILCKLPETVNVMEQKFDVDKDGDKEITMCGKNQNFLLNSDFKVMAMLPGWQLLATRKQTHTSPVQYILSGRSNSIGVTLHKNRYYWLERHLRPFSVLLLATIFLLILTLGFKEHQQHLAIERYVEHILQTDSRAIAIFDDRFRLLKNNQQFDEFFDYPNSTGRTRNIFDLLQEHGEVIRLFAAWRHGYNHIRRHSLVKISTEKGEKTLRMSIDPVPRSLMARRVFQLSFEDESVRAELEKAKSWTKLAQRVAHDLKNPLGSILLIIQKMRTLINRKPDDLDHQLENNFSKIEGRIESLRVLTRNFMKFTNLEEPQFAVVDLSAFLQQALDTLKLACPPDIRITRRFAKDNLKVSLDAEQMQSVIENLVNNAIDAMPEGGRISVSTRLAQHLQITPHDGQPRKYAIIEIRDDGQGIPVDVLDRIFEPNFSGAKESSGLGLAIVQKIVTDHQGQIEVESEPGAGSIFSIYLPALQS